MRWIFMFLIFSPTLLASQTISGVIYSEENKLEYISVTNITQGLKTQSTKDGYFSINAIENDTLLFSSSLYINKKITVTALHFKEKLIVELETPVNELEEVYITNTTFNEKEYSLKLKKQFLYDIEHNPQEYVKPASGYVDFMKIFKDAKKYLGKNKKTITNEKPEYLSYEEINKVLLKQNNQEERIVDIIEISEESYYLFIDFCIGKIEKHLLDDKNYFLLLDKMFDLAKEFK